MLIYFRLFLQFADTISHRVLEACLLLLTTHFQNGFIFPLKLPDLDSLLKQQTCNLECLVPWLFPILQDNIRQHSENFQFRRYKPYQRNCVAVIMFRLFNTTVFIHLSLNAILWWRVQRRASHKQGKGEQN